MYRAHAICHMSGLTTGDNHTHTSSLPISYSHYLPGWVVGYVCVCVCVCVVGEGVVGSWHVECAMSDWTCVCVCIREVLIRQHVCVLCCLCAIFVD